MSDDKLVLLRRFYDPTQAHIIRAKLEVSEISCFIMDEHHNASAWHLGIALGGIRVMVLSSDYDAANDLVRSEMDNYYAQTRQDNKPIIRKPYLKTFLGTVLGLIVGAPSIWRSKKK